MSAFTDIINSIQSAETMRDKSQLLTYLGRALSANRKKLSPADRTELGAFTLSELEEVPARLNKTENYREKDEIFGIMDSLMNLVMICYDSPAAMPRDKVEMIQRVLERCNKERFLENAIDEAFKGNPDEADMERILCMAAPLKDEFQKGQLWHGLLHYKGQVNTLSNDAKAVLAKYAVSELNRFAEARREGTFTEEMKDQLEFICDAAGCLMFNAPVNPELVGLIGDLLELKDGDISYYALSTLLLVNGKPSDGKPFNMAISLLAHNATYADMTYHLLERHSMTDCFPAELRDPAYLAKSDLVHWLTYPTELGREPDEIELLGVTKKKGETFHVFRYKSDSDNLGDDLKGVWLIGWSGNDGGTFSNFDKYADYEKKTPEKTVKYIRRKLL
jgi:hypothetical protein